MKNLWKNSLLLSIALLCCSTGKAQMEASAYKRPLGKVPVGWRKIVLPNALFGKVSGNFSDVRILGVSAGGDTLEAPYVWRSGERKATSEALTFNTRNVTKNAKGYYYTFEMPAAEPVNELVLKVGNTNFDWRVQLEGSQNETEWFTILNDYRILGIRNAQTDFQFTTLRFPNVRYRYLRLLVKNSTEAPQDLSASISQIDSAAGQYQSYPVVTQTRAEDKSTKQTQLEIILSEPVPVSQILVPVTDSFDYYRPVTIEYISDSFQTPAGWRYNWGQLFTGTLNSVDRSAFEFESTVAQQLRITLENGDNRPLHIGEAKVTGLIYTLFARFDEPADYFLVYGNPNATAPDYDIARFPDKIPANPPALAIGAEEAIAHATVPPAEPLFKNKLWLWGVIVGIGLLLGVATLKMMRKG